jgi:hypothetical protein
MFPGAALRGTSFPLRGLGGVTSPCAMANTFELPANPVVDYALAGILLASLNSPASPRSSASSTSAACSWDASCRSSRST